MEVEEGERVDIAWPDVSLVYATPLLQHQARYGLNPALDSFGARSVMAAYNDQVVPSLLLDHYNYMRAAAEPMGID